jgi:hypothetical protein
MAQQHRQLLEVGLGKRQLKEGHWVHDEEQLLVDGLEKGQLKEGHLVEA